MNRGPRALRAALAGVLALALCLPLACSQLPMKPRVAVSVEGTIRDEDGPAVRGARVELNELAEWPADFKYLARWTAVTDDSGHYRVEVPSGRYDALVRPAGGDFHRTAGVYDVELTQAHSTLDYTYRGVRLSGRILGPDSTLLPGAHLEFEGMQRYGPFLSKSGQFTLLIAPGTYRLRVTPPSDTLGLYYLDFPGVAVQADTTADFQVSGHRVSGRVSGPDGTPLGHPRISAKGSRALGAAQTDADGRYDLLLPAGTYEFNFTPGPADQALASRSLGFWTISGPADLDWSITGAWWSGIVIDGATGGPVPGVAVMVQEELGRGMAITTTGDDGRYSLLVARGLVYEMSARAYGPYRWAYIPWMLAGADSTIDIVLPAAVTQAAAPAR